MSVKAPQKILIIRFSSIGDIVLTFPVVKALKLTFPNCKIDFVTKKGFVGLLQACPEIDHIFALDQSLSNLRKEIPFAQYDAVIDLHHNLRSRLLTIFHLGKVYRFPKDNLRKWLLTSFKIKPKHSKHVVDRYLEPVRRAFQADFIGVQNAYQVPKDAQIDILEKTGFQPGQYVAVAIGAQFATKRMPTEILISLLQKINGPILLLGGKEDIEVAQKIMKALPNVSIQSQVGKCSIHESAWLVQNAAQLLTHDTGLMHIGACFQMPIHLIWGNTVRDFGMYPYRLEQENCFHYEVQDLACRPCSKIGHQACPKGHFSCMRKQNIEQIATELNKA
jgi:ADP-heptose:LPS heptosyltransferase